MGMPTALLHCPHQHRRAMSQVMVDHHRRDTKVSLPLLYQDHRQDHHRRMAENRQWDILVHRTMRVRWQLRTQV